MKNSEIGKHSRQTKKKKNKGDVKKRGREKKKRQKEKNITKKGERKGEVKEKTLHGIIQRFILFMCVYGDIHEPSIGMHKNCSF